MDDDSRRTVLRAIRAADLGLLVSGGRAAKATCVSCSREVTEEEFGGFVNTSEGPLLFCERPECLEFVMSGRRR
jgi:hypothetical protein